MAQFITYISLDPGLSNDEFLKGLFLLTSDANLQALKLHDDMTTSVTHRTNGELDITLAFSERDEQNRTWNTTATIKRTSENANAKIEKTALSSASDLHYPEKPLLLDLILDCFGSAGEAPFKQSMSAYIVYNNNYFSHVENLITGKNCPKHPVVYFTKNFLTEKALTADQVAQRLYGIGFVWIQRDDHVGKSLKKRWKGKKAMPANWPNCLFWPEIAGPEQHFLCLNSIEEIGCGFLDKIERQIQEIIAKNDQTEKLPDSDANHNLTHPENSKSGKRETTSLTCTYNRSLENTSSTNSLNNDESMHKVDFLELKKGEIDDIIQNESLEMVLDAIQNYLDSKTGSEPTSANSPSRRAEVLQSVLNANPLTYRQVAAKANRAASIVRGKDSINEKTESDLKKIGIRTKHGKNHPKLLYGENGRYQITLASSSSDRNAWLNVVTQLNKTFF